MLVLVLVLEMVAGWSGGCGCGCGMCECVSSEAREGKCCDEFHQLFHGIFCV